MWSFFCDRGGSFCDIVARTPTGELRTAKVLSVNDKEYEDAAVHGICQFLGVNTPAEIPPNTIDVVRVGTTVATNALLERRGAPTVFITTKGFRDSLRIGHQARPDLFARNIQLHTMLYREDCVIEVDERIGADGSVVVPLNEDDLKQQLAATMEKLSKQMKDDASSSSASGGSSSSSDNNIYGISAAIVFVHSYKYPQHEKRAADLAKAAGFAEVCASHVVSPIIRFVPRGDTTVVDAYVTPPVVAYASRLQRLLPKGTKLQFMQSSGGLADASHFRGKDAVLSGPAGGVVGMVETALAAGVAGKVIGFDSGGTSCDTSCYCGEYERDTANTIEGIRVRAPMMSIHTIAAGGGSVLGFDGHRLLVGPRSVGAQPGPACYGRGGDLSITDANVLLGRINPSYFPATFGTDSKQKLDTAIVEEKFRALAERVNLPAYRDPRYLAAAFIALAAQQMADAVKKISVEKGYDISGDRDYVLQCFGGSGGQLACAVADNLGMRRIMMHPCASVLSAYGIGLAKAACAKMGDLNLRISRALRPSRSGDEKEEEEDDADDDSDNKKSGVVAAAAASPVNDDEEMNKIRSICNRLEQEALVELGIDGSSDEKRPRLLRKYILHVCYDGGDVPLDVHLSNSNSDSPSSPSSSSPLDTISAAHIWSTFEDAYRTRYSHVMPNDIIATVATVEVLVDESLLEGCRTTEQIALANNNNNSNSSGATAAAVAETKVACFAGGVMQRQVPLYDRDKLPAEAVVGECSLIVDRLTTTLVESRWTARLDKDAILWIDKMDDEEKQEQQQQQQQQQQTSSLSSQPDPLRLEVMGHLFMNIAEQSGIQLQNTAWSVNIKERLDFSCAIFTKEGLLVANAPHMPVHLGSMGMSIKRVLDVMEEIRTGVMTMDNADVCDYFAEDVFIVNDPQYGGTHLPDITLISPVFADPSCTRGRKPDFFVASRGHHADVGGTTPGSLPPFSKHIDEEGVRLNGFRWRSGDPKKTDSSNSSSGVRRDDALRILFTVAQDEGREARNWPQNLGDLLAQIAANERGARELQAAVQRYGLPELQRYMGFLLDFGEKSVREALSFMPKGFERTGEVRLDNGAKVKVKVTVGGSDKKGEENVAATIDFTGSSKMLNNNFNAPRAVTLAAVLYSVRLLVANNSLPLNEGCLRPLKIIIPDRSCLAAEHPAAVVAGNVEMSMCVTNAILHAFGALADAQPTMNNFTFGIKSSSGSGDGFGKQYYETICGGTGGGPWKLHAHHHHPPPSSASAAAAAAAAASSSSSSSSSEPEGFSGASAIQSHMTNSRLTDVEILETRYPVRLEKFEIARGTGGAGKFRGGDGTRRAVTFLAPAEVCILSNGRRFAARGLEGGADGALGRNSVIRGSGKKKGKEEEELDSLVQIDVQAGDTVVVQTPGGGGYLNANEK